MSYRYKTLKEIPQEHRPREKLLKLGAQNLSDEELLAVVFGSGTRDYDVMTLAKEITGLGWDRLESMSIEELTAVKGVGKVKALQIKALIELSKRIREPFGGTKVLSPEDAYSLLKDSFHREKETLMCLYLDLSHRVRRMETVAVGSANMVFIKVKDILKPAVESSSYGIILSHNHPQGSSKPSQEDIKLTQKVREACELLGFELIDHIVIGEDGFTSMRERGILI